MSDYKPISDQLASKVEKMGPRARMHLGIMGDSPQNYQALLEYLSSEGIPEGQQHRLPVMNMVFAHLTQDQIYAAADLPYVKAMIENQPVHLMKK